MIEWINHLLAVCYSIFGYLDLNNLSSVYFPNNYLFVWSTNNSIQLNETGTEHPPERDKSVQNRQWQTHLWQMYRQLVLWGEIATHRVNPTCVLGDYQKDNVQHAVCPIVV